MISKIDTCWRKL